jgi:hypothetical protein
MYYKAIIECGHVGAGKSIDMVRYFMSDNMVDLFSAAARMPRAKGKACGTGIKLIEKISRNEYEEGRYESKSNSYLQKRKNRNRKKKPVRFYH